MELLCFQKFSKHHPLFDIFHRIWFFFRRLIGFGRALKFFRRATRSIPVRSWNRDFDAIYELQPPYLLSYRKIDKCYEIVTFFPWILAQQIVDAGAAIWRYATLTHADVNIFSQRWCALTAPAPLFLGRSEKRKVLRNRHNFAVIMDSTFFVWRR